MSFAVAALLVLGVAALVAYPLVAMPDGRAADDHAADRETLEHAKNVALLAIREADLDRAMGKLSDEDYDALRGLYERRALTALDALEATTGSPGAATPPNRHLADGHRAFDVGAEDDGAVAARFCAGCGRGFVSDERFCPACGRARAS